MLPHDVRPHMLSCSDVTLRVYLQVTVFKMYCQVVKTDPCTVHSILTLDHLY